MRNRKKLTYKKVDVLETTYHIFFLKAHRKLSILPNFHNLLLAIGLFLLLYPEALGLIGVGYTQV